MTFALALGLIFLVLLGLRKANIRLLSAIAAASFVTVLSLGLTLYEHRQPAAPSRMKAEIMGLSPAGQAFVMRYFETRDQNRRLHPVTNGEFNTLLMQVKHVAPDGIVPVPDNRSTPPSILIMPPEPKAAPKPSFDPAPGNQPREI
ncbi:hypothetical protein [Sphingosinicella sp. BN140058]|uniref:hypothetical protein n=1 Tax=Sphingosinicella sp. BN140058 TaxID=1892855 RepID=UPI001011D288|nr:hypothetical protein [Sphingosinicella sp. BN140058]QAY80191.1 hypothetical protein ETR14_26475 [Sphingosinicella sp. BN140058]